MLISIDNETLPIRCTNRRARQLLHSQDAAIQQSPFTIILRNRERAKSAIIADLTKTIDEAPLEALFEIEFLLESHISKHDQEKTE